MSASFAYVVQALLTLLGVALVALLILYATRRGLRVRRSGPLELKAHLPLDGRRAVYLVRVIDRAFVIAVSEAGVAKLGEFPADELPENDSEAVGFAAALRAAIDRRRGPQ